jgi:hypothetical protein
MAQTGGTAPQNVNFAIKTGPIAEFLAENNFTTPVLDGHAQTLSFDEISDSVVQVRSGDVSEAFLKQPKIICSITYNSIWDFWYRFNLFDVEFYDAKDGTLLLKAGHYVDDMVSSEDAVIDRVFEKISQEIAKQ